MTTGDSDEAERAASLRRALVELAGSAPDDGDMPAQIRFAADLGVVRAIIDQYWEGLLPHEARFAEECRQWALGALTDDPPGVEGDGDGGT